MYQEKPTRNQEQSSHIAGPDQGDPAEAHQIDDKLNRHDASFRRHYQLNYSSEPMEYESFFAPAYRFGYELSEQNPNAEWEDVEEDAHSHWVANHQVSWETVADAVEYGWQEERNPDEHRVNQSHGAA